jgi:hypothetical protein
LASLKQGTGQSLMVGLFESVQRASGALDGLVAAGLDETAVGLMMSDRAAERAFGPPEARDAVGATSAFSNLTHRLAARLRPMAALGTPGAGLVATGPLAAALVSGGLGARSGLEQALGELGASADAAEAARRVKNGAVLVSTPPAEGGAAQAEPVLQSQSSMFWQLQLERPLATPALITAPAAAAGEQRARYEPLLETPDEATGSASGASRSGT